MAGPLARGYPKEKWRPCPWELPPTVGRRDSHPSLFESKMGDFQAWLGLVLGYGDLGLMWAVGGAWGGRAPAGAQMRRV